jgi:hypothetical protein
MKSIVGDVVLALAVAVGTIAIVAVLAGRLL